MGYALPELVGGEKRGHGLHAGRGLHGLHFEGGLFGGGFLLGLEVAADADAMEAAIDPPRGYPVAVFKTTDGKRLFVFHA